jgi:hypothetical protein
MRRHLSQLDTPHQALVTHQALDTHQVLDTHQGQALLGMLQALGTHQMLNTRLVLDTHRVLHTHQAPPDTHHSMRQALKALMPAQ